MSKMKALALALVLGSGISFVGSAAQACGSVAVDAAGHRQNVEVSDRGCNKTKVLQRGQHNDARVDTDGWRNSTWVTQVGRNQRVNVTVRGDVNRTHVFTGICPPGSSRRNLDVAGDRGVHVLVPTCR